MRRAAIGWLALVLGTAWGLAVVPDAPDAQIVCAKTNEKGKTKFTLRDVCKTKETGSIDLATTSSGLETRVTDLETDVTTLEGDVGLIEADVALIEDDLMTVRVPDSCSRIHPIQTSPIDPRGCAPGVSPGDTCTTTTSCDAGQFAAAGACRTTSAAAVARSVPDGSTGWTCQLIRTEPTLLAAKWTAGVLCCE